MEELEKVEIALAVLFLLKEPVAPIDLHVASGALPNTLSTETI